MNRILGYTNGLWIESEVNDQLFRRTGYAAEICVTGGRIVIVELEPELCCGCGSSLLLGDRRCSWCRILVAVFLL